MDDWFAGSGSFRFLLTALDLEEPASTSAEHTFRGESPTNGGGLHARSRMVATQGRVRTHRARTRSTQLGRECAHVARRAAGMDAPGKYHGLARPTCHSASAAHLESWSPFCRCSEAAPEQRKELHRRRSRRTGHHQKQLQQQEAHFVPPVQSPLRVETSSDEPARKGGKYQRS